MPKQHYRINRKTPLALVVAFVGAIATIVTALITVLVPPLLEIVNSSSVPPTPSCISAADILVTFQIKQNNEMIAELAPGETVFLSPDLRVYFAPKIESISNIVLPKLECEWANTGIATDGKLLHNASCAMVDYQSGLIHIEDAVVMQLSQPSCPALAPYSLFVMPKP